MKFPIHTAFGNSLAMRICFTRTDEDEIARQFSKWKQSKLTFKKQEVKMYLLYQLNTSVEIEMEQNTILNKIAVLNSVALISGLEVAVMASSTSSSLSGEHF